MKPPRAQRATFQWQIIGTALAALAPMLIAALVLAFANETSLKVRLTVAVFAVFSVFVATYALHERLVYPLRTLTNLISALREEDYSLRARNINRSDVLGEVLREVNELRLKIAEQKLTAIESGALLRAVLAEIDAAIFAFDPDDRLRLVNRAGERLLDKPPLRLLGFTAAELGIDDLLRDDAPQTVDRTFSGGNGRWSVRRSTFREEGVPHRLVVVADISRELREEEAQAWQRIVRVLSHELNNSLAPIRSIAESVGELVKREPLPDDWREDAGSGLQVISSRADALTRFMRAYAQLAKVPHPRKAEVDLRDLAKRAAALETRVPVEVVDGPPVVVNADGDQLEQLLINLLRNAVDASLETGGGVRVRCSTRGNNAIVEVEDDGLGLSGSANLFVPFFTTKPNGSGIGLVLSRQIAEAHGGTVTLENRSDARGCVATLRIPI